MLGHHVECLCCGCEKPCTFVLLRYARLLRDLSHAVSVGGFQDPKDVVEYVFGEAAEASIITMQNEIESLCHNIRKQERKRDAAAGMTRLCCGATLQHGVGVPVAWPGNKLPLCQRLSVKCHAHVSRRLNNP